MTNRTGQTSSTGLPPQTAAALAYLAWWLSGLLFYLMERDNRFVKFHAAQSMVALGGIWIAGVILLCLGFAALFISAVVFKALLFLSYGVWTAGLIVWALSIVRAWKGEEFELPWAGPVARRLVSGMKN